MAASVNPNQAPAGESPEPARRDFRQEVTDRIVQMLETGVAPWQKPWNSTDASLEMPTNPTTGKAYRGGNAIHLMATGLNRGYGDPRWMTYRQAGNLASHVRKGEKGTQIEFWELKTGRDIRSQPVCDGDSDGPQPADEHDDHRGNRLIHRVYTVFNAKQIEGIPEWTAKQRSAFEVVEAGEQILQNSGATILHDQSDRAFYNRSADSIHLPVKHAFNDAAGYYGTALHELAHWSGHPSRLNRATLSESYRFGDISYAKEELRAELASVFLAAERGIPHDPEQHAAYVSSWINVLKQDKNEIFRAAHDASRAADFLLAMDRNRSLGEDATSSRPMNCPKEFRSALNVIEDRESAKHERFLGGFESGFATSAATRERSPNRGTFGPARTLGRGR